jgi:cystathionine beta-lyase/cystathionine gamma-synthase
VKFNTKAVHSGEIEDPRFGNVVTPIFQTSTFLQPNPSSEPYLDLTSGGPFLYTRWGNPTLQSLEQKYAALEEAKFALSFSSGMSAISSAVMAMVKAGQSILSVAELYGQTFHLFAHVLPKYGVRVDFVPADKLNELDVKMEDYSLVYLESITNPLLKVLDIREISKAAAESHVPVLVDATFASPFNQRPLELGAEVVVHSATKYIAGHSDVIIGVAGTNSEERFKGLVSSRKDFGGSPDPHQAYLTLRGLKTLGLRVERQNSNAMALAKMLNQSRKVRTVHYPGLTDSPYFNVARRNLTGFGGMVSFELRDEECAKRFLRSLTIPRSAPSLGGVESLITRPVETSHSSLSKEEREKIGIRDSLVRFSAGIEDQEDLLEDFQRALEAC